MKTEQQKAAEIRALLEERRGYIARGLPERVAQVDYFLAQLGHEAAKPSERAEKRPVGRPRKVESRA